MELLLESIKMDWPVLLPIFACSILVLGVVISKWSFYQKNQRDITVYMRELNSVLSKNDLSAAQNIAIRCGGVIGEVIEEAVRIFSEQKNGFSRSFDISAACASAPVARSSSPPRLCRFLLPLTFVKFLSPFLIINIHLSNDSTL